MTGFKPYHTKLYHIIPYYIILYLDYTSRFTEKLYKHKHYINTPQKLMSYSAKSVNRFQTIGLEISNAEGKLVYTYKSVDLLQY